MSDRREIIAADRVWIPQAGDLIVRDTGEYATVTEVALRDDIGPYEIHVRLAESNMHLLLSPSCMVHYTLVPKTLPR